ncbi:hypothetical protein ACQPYE_32060 [Actinosynnema sp. CA-299493]
MKPGLSTSRSPAEADRSRPSPADAVVTAIEQVIAEWPDDEPPITVAVTGWDTGGRPDIADLLRERLPARSHVLCSFDAADWEGDARPAGALLARGVARAAGQRRNWVRRAFQPISVEMSSPRTRRRRKVLAGVVSAFIAVGVVALPDVRAAAFSLAGKGGPIGEIAAQAVRSPVVAAVLLALVFWVVLGRAWTATTAVARFAASVRDEATKGTFEEVREQLTRLIRQALRARRHGRRFVVVVRNIDRCGGDFVLDLCEKAKKIVRAPGVVLVFLGDLRTMEEAAVRKTGLPVESAHARRLGRRHVRNLIPNVVALPHATSDEVWER